LFDDNRTNDYGNSMTTIEQSYPPMREIVLKLGILSFGLFVVGTNAFVIAGLLPKIADTLGVTPAVVSYSITFYALVVAIVAPVISISLSRMSTIKSKPF